MDNLTVKVRKYTETIEQRPAKEVLMDMLHEVRPHRDEDTDGAELDLFRSAENGYMSRFSTIKSGIISDDDWENLMEASSDDKKEEMCTILAKYAEHIDCEYGICMYTSEA